MKIGILQTGHAPDEILPVLGDYDTMFQHLLNGQGFTFETYPVVDGVFPENAKAADGWLITGSKHGAYEELLWIRQLEDLIVDIVQANRPLVGICFGHQLIAQALGGKVEKFAGGWAVGPQTYDFGGQSIALNAWHQDQVTELPEGATVIASNDFCANAAVVYGDRALTIQAHPEYGPDVIEGLIAYRGRGNVPDPLLDEAAEKLDDPIASSTIADQMADFFRKERA